MELTLGLAQCCHPAEVTAENVVAMAEQWCRRAVDAGVDLLMFPESMMTRYESDYADFVAAAQPLDGPYCAAMDELAQRFGLWLVYTVNELNPDGNPFNTAIMTGPDGVRRGSYRKVHLYDTDFTRESDRMAAGDELFAPIDTPFGKIGLAICYDVRFPEVARRAALAGCRLWLDTAAWVAGPLKTEHWRTLLSARAIENGMFVAGVSRVDRGYNGQSVVCGPDGLVRVAGGVHEELVVARIDLDDVDKVRASMPLLKHRRPECYAL